MTLKAHVEAEKKTAEEQKYDRLSPVVLCNLTLDEMAIRKSIQFDGKKFRGFVDMGTGVDDDAAQLLLMHWSSWLWP